MTDPAPLDHLWRLLTAIRDDQPVPDTLAHALPDAEANGWVHAGRLTTAGQDALDRLDACYPTRWTA